MELIPILTNYIRFFLPFGIYIVWYFLFYFIIIWGFKFLKIVGVPKPKIRIYIILIILFGLFVKPLIYSIFSNIPGRLIPYLAYLLAEFLFVFLLLRYYFQLSGKKLWQFFLYLIVINIIFNLIISTLLS